MKEKKLSTLKEIVPLSTPELRKYLRCSKDDVFLVLGECLYNAVKGNVDVKIKNIEKYENVGKLILKRNTSVEKRRALFLTKTGFELLKLIVKFCYIHLSYRKK